MNKALIYLFFFLIATNSSAATIGQISPAQIFSNDQINVTLFLPDSCTSITAESPIIDINNRIIRFNVEQLPLPIVCTQIVRAVTETFGPLSPGNYSIQVYRDNILQDSREITVINANPIPVLNIYSIILLSVLFAGIARKRRLK